MKSAQHPLHAVRSKAAVHPVLRELAAQGYAITGQRSSVVQAIVSRSRLFTADELMRELQTDGVKVGRATVFRTLDLLERVGYVGRVADGDRMAYTTCNLCTHHHHLVCSQCGQVLHLSGCPVSGILEDLQSRTGYRIQHHSLEVTGLCPSCQLQHDPVARQVAPARPS